MCWNEDIRNQALVFRANLFAYAIQFCIDGRQTFQALLRFDKEAFCHVQIALQTQRGCTGEELGELIFCIGFSPVRFYLKHRICVPFQLTKHDITSHVLV
jgi:hypothetical protein